MLVWVAVVTLLARRTAEAPPVVEGSGPGEFSAEGAMAHVREIARGPHPNGSAENARVREYVVGQLRAMGLDVRVVKGEVYSGPVWNVTARLPGARAGSAGRRSVLLAAHYDSVLYGPGAGDDAAGVGAILEAVRALRAGPPLRHDVKVLITDGEERGLQGARAFFADPATAEWRADIRVALNFEARGTGGPSLMFETAPGNAAVIGHFARASPHPLANSLSYDVYKMLRNDTDFTEFRRGRLQGLNFAFIGNSFRYHTRDDSVENLDRRSAFHHASHALHLARHFGDLGDAELDAVSAPQGDAVYFNASPTVLVRYPIGWVWPLAGAQFLLTAWVVAWGVRRGAVTAGGTGRGFVGMVVAGVFCVAATLALTLILPAARSPATFGGQLLLIVSACAVVTVGSAMAFRGRSTAADRAAAGLIVFSALSIPVNVWLPGGSFLMLWPALFATGGLAAAVGLRAGSIGRGVACAVAVVPALVIFVPMIELLFTALGLRLAPALSVFVALATWVVMGAVGCAGFRKAGLEAT